VNKGDGDGGDGGGIHCPVHSRSTLSAVAVAADVVAPVVAVGALEVAAVAAEVGYLDEQDAMADGAAERAYGPSYCNQSTRSLHGEDRSAPAPF